MPARPRRPPWREREECKSPSSSSSSAPRSVISSLNDASLSSVNALLSKQHHAPVRHRVIAAQQPVDVVEHAVHWEEKYPELVQPDDAHQPIIVAVDQPDEDTGDAIWEEEDESVAAPAGGHEPALSQQSHADPHYDSDASSIDQRTQRAAADAYRDEQMRSLARDGSTDAVSLPVLERERTQIAIDSDDDVDAQRPLDQASGAISVELPKELVLRSAGNDPQQGKKAKSVKAPKPQHAKMTAHAKAVVLRIRRIHLLTQLILVQRWSGLCDQPEVQATLLSLLPERFHLTDEAPHTPLSSSSTSSVAPSLLSFNVGYLQGLLSWFHNFLFVDSDVPAMLTSLCSLGHVPLYVACMVDQLTTALRLRRGAAQAKLLLFVALLRAMGLQVRYVHGMEVEGYAWNQETWMDALRLKAGSGVEVRRSATISFMGQLREINYKPDNLRKLWKVVNARIVSRVKGEEGRASAIAQWMCECGKPVELKHAELAARVLPPARSGSVTGRTISIGRTERDEVVITDGESQEDDEKAEHRELQEPRSRKEQQREEQLRQVESQALTVTSSASSGKKRARKQVVEYNEEEEEAQPKQRRASRTKRQKKQESPTEGIEDEEDDEKAAPLSAKRKPGRPQQRQKEKKAKEKEQKGAQEQELGVRRSPRVNRPLALPEDDDVIVLSSDDEAAVARIKAAEESRQRREMERLGAMEADLQDVPSSDREREEGAEPSDDGEDSPPSKKRRAVRRGKRGRQRSPGMEDEDVDDDAETFEMPSRSAPSSSPASSAGAVAPPSSGCMVCGSHSSTKANRVLLCDRCDGECHLKCTQPRLREIPEGLWFCHRCIEQNQTSAVSRQRISQAKPERSQSIDDQALDGGAEEEENVFAQFRFSGSVDDAVRLSGKEEKLSASQPKRQSSEDDDDSSVFEDVSSARKRQTTRKTPVKKTDSAAASTASSSSSASASAKRAMRRGASSPAGASSSPSPPPSKAKVKVDSSVMFVPFWCEVYCPAQERWIHVDPLNCLLDKPEVYESIRPRHTFSYVLAAYPTTQPHRTSSSSTSLRASSSPFGSPIIADVTPRYSVGDHTVPRQRVDEGWWDRLRMAVSAPLSVMDRPLHEAEQLSFRSSLTSQQAQYPTSMAALKKHPMYTCQEHIKKFEALRPGSRPVTRLRLGKADVSLFLRSDVCPLHTVDRWLREKRQVRESELARPVKLVRSFTMASRKKRRIRRAMAGAGDFDALSLDQAASQPSSGSLLDDVDDELATLYGEWQTDPWTPPPAKNGVVPKNARGQVDLWDPSHLPGGCVHLPYPRIASIARKLGVDCADAMTGFEIKHGRSVPHFEGIVVAKENAELVLDAYQQREREVQAKEDAKRWERVSFNWTRMVKKLLVRARVMQQFAERDRDGEGRMGQRAGDGGQTGGKREAQELLGKEGKKKVAPTGAAVAEAENDVLHVHDFSYSKSMDPETGVWSATCRCGARSTFEEI